MTTASTVSSKVKPVRVLGQTSAYVILGIGLVATLLPFVYVFFSTLKPDIEQLLVPPTFFPQNWTLEHYIHILTDKSLPLHRFLANSLLVSVSRVCITLFTSSFAGYIFAKYQFRGKQFAFYFILAQIMIPFQVIMIPAYLLLVKLGLIDSLWGLIIPAMVDAFGMFMMKQFIETLPSELMDAARIDGASEFGIYLRIVLPQIGAPLASLGIFTFMATWNDYLWPLIVITSHEKRTLPLLLTWYNTQHSSNPGLSSAAGMLLLAPIFLIYIFAQRWVVESATQSGIK